MNQQAILFNSKVQNNYGKQKFTVIHSGGLVSEWSAISKNHLDRLLRIEVNMGYMLSIDKISNEKDKQFISTDLQH